MPEEPQILDPSAVSGGAGWSSLNLSLAAYSQTQLGCEAPTGHWGAALPHAKLRGLSPRLPDFPKPHLPCLGLKHQLAAPDQCGFWMMLEPGGLSHPNTLPHSLPRGCCTPSHSSHSQVGPLQTPQSGNTRVLNMGRETWTRLKEMPSMEKAWGLEGLCSLLQGPRSALRPPPPTPTPVGSKRGAWNSNRFTAFVFWAEPAPAPFRSCA